MMSDDMMQAAAAMEMAEEEKPGEKLIRLRIKFRESIHKEISRRADELRIGVGDYLEILHNISGKTGKEKEVVQLKTMLEAAAKTIAMYRVKLKEHCIPCDSFVEEEDGHAEV